MFAHGQLYVGISRVGSPDKLRIAVMLDKEKNLEEVKNVVYKEVSVSYTHLTLPTICSV